jgi:hypothetical protein
LNIYFSKFWNNFNCAVKENFYSNDDNEVELSDRGSWSYSVKEKSIRKEKGKNSYEKRKGEIHMTIHTTEWKNLYDVIERGKFQ